MKKSFRRAKRLLGGRRPQPSAAPEDDGPVLVEGQWDVYAKNWQSARFSKLADHSIEHLGDEWTTEDPESGGSTYGLAPGVTAAFGDYLREKLLDPYLPKDADVGLEIGPGGGRLTEILLPRTKALHVADVSEEMLRHLRNRFGDSAGIVYHHTDGATLPAIGPASCDYAISLDVFVHIEPRLIYWYLKQIVALLRPGGVGIIHYSNVTTERGWHKFEHDLERNLRVRVEAAAFAIMCPQIMGQFLATLDVEVVSLDLDIIPRDAVAVFRRIG